MNPLLSVSDVVAVLQSLGYRLTERQVRYLGLAPSLRLVGLNAGRLYGAEDAAVFAVFAELLARCRHWELPAWSARAAIRYLDADLRRALSTRRGPRYLAVHPITGTAALVDAPSPHTIDLRDVSERVTAAVRAHRATYPEVWTGAAYVPVEELVTA